jgi:hypothetical protein
VGIKIQKLILKRTQGNNMYKSIATWLQYNHFSNEPLIIKKLRLKGFNDSEILKILESYDTTCQCCMDAESGCQCWNDE